MTMRLIITALALAWSSVAPAAPLEGVALEAAATVDAFHAALRRGDTVGAAALVADDAVVFESGEAERSKAEYAAHHLAADAAFSTAVSSTTAHRFGGGEGNLAWVATEGRTKGSYKGKPIDSATTETMLLRRTPDGWRIIHVHWSSAR
jgi:ketosteroid isomerase-like protein